MLFRDRADASRVWVCLVGVTVKDAGWASFIHIYSPLPRRPPPSSSDFATASALFLDSIATFTATELFDYNRLVLYTVLLALKELDRASLKKRVIGSPDVAAVIDRCGGRILGRNIYLFLRR